MITYFHLDTPESERWLADYDPNAPSPQHEYLHLDGGRRISELALAVKHNRRDELIVWPWIGLCIIHASLLDRFWESGFTGYWTRPATLRFRDGEVSREYRELDVTGWAGIARPESGVHVVKDCPACHWKKYSRLTGAEHLIDWD